MLYCLTCTFFNPRAAVVSSNCTDGSVRLVNGVDAKPGKLEICVEGVYGGVCNEHWTKSGSEVICKQLGLSSTSKLHDLATWLLSSGYIRCIRCTPRFSIFQLGTDSSRLQPRLQRIVHWDREGSEPLFDTPRPLNGMYRCGRSPVHR